MIGVDVVTRGLPDGLAPRLIEEAHPDKQIVGIAAQAVLRAHAIKRQVGQEAVEVSIVGATVAV